MTNDRDFAAPNIGATSTAVGAMPPPVEIAAMTPMLRQYFDMKQRCPDALLFMRMGDFYEVFGGDAEVVAPILGLVLTSRERGDDQRVPFCGVPHHSARTYYLKLLRQGFKVAIADQLEDPATAKGLVKRDIVRVLTPGCIDDPDGLEPGEPNYLMAVHEEPSQGTWAVAIADISTGELRLGAASGQSEIRSLVLRLQPKELLARRFLHGELEVLLADVRSEERLVFGALPEGPLRDEAEQGALLTGVLGAPPANQVSRRGGGKSTFLVHQPCGAIAGGEAVIASLFAHLKSLSASLAAFLDVKPLLPPKTMVLDETAIRDLELFETARRRDAEGSLLKAIDQTTSAMGARLLRHTIRHPLADGEQIKRRQGAVKALAGRGETWLGEWREQLRHLPDLERLAARISAAAASPGDLARVAQALARAQWLLGALASERSEGANGKFGGELFSEIEAGVSRFSGALELIGRALEPAPQALGIGSGEGVFRLGYDETLDRLVAMAKSGTVAVETYQEQLRRSTSIGSLKIKNHKSYGLLIEVTRTHAAKIPANFVRRQTMVNGDRFTTVELQELNDSLAEAADRAVAREQELWQTLLRELARHRSDLQAVAAGLALFDVVQSFAWQALKAGYCEPKISSDGRIELKGSRHPVVERLLGRHRFSPNDVSIPASQRHLLITGPNMAGKSTLMRQVAVAALLHQIGSFVPALAARLPIFDRIFTRVGAGDDLARGHSTFLVEMSEAASILRHATRRSLVVLDEVGRGTSTRDGLALASAILEDLARRIGCYTLFATHYHELVPFAEKLPGVRPVQTEVIERDGRVVFTHRLKDGPASSSYGLEVARIAGLPGHVVDAAAQFLNQSDQANPPPATRASAKAHREQGEAPPLERLGFVETGLAAAPTGEAAAIVARLLSLNINRLTPIQALNILSELRNESTGCVAHPLFAEGACSAVKQSV